MAGRYIGKVGGEGGKVERETIAVYRWLSKVTCIYVYIYTYIPPLWAGGSRGCKSIFYFLAIDISYIDGWIDGWMDRWIDRWIDGQISSLVRGKGKSMPPQLGNMYVCI